MKKFIVIPLFLTMILSLCSCGSSSPEDTVKSFCSAMQNFDTQTMATFLMDYEPTDSSDTNDNLGQNEFSEFIKQYSSQIKYNIEKTEINEDKAVVTVKFDYPDLSPVVPDILDGYYEEVIIMLYGGATEDEMAQLMAKHFKAGLEGYDPVTISDTIGFSLIKEDGTWKLIDFPDKIEDIMAGNINEGYDYYNNHY